MDFNDQLLQLASKITKMREAINTEEAAKMAFVAPLINLLGYDIFNPTEVVPEYVCDVGTKKGEKVDYALMLNDEPVILIECKGLGSPLSVESASQLYRYFSVTKARIAIITDGIRYRLFSDLDEPNKMDAKPFLEFSVLDDQETFAAELKKLSKQSFNLDTVLDSAKELKYTREIKKILFHELQSPSEEMVRLIAGRIYLGVKNQKVIQQFTDLFSRAFEQFINDRINERLKSAMVATSAFAHAPESETVGSVQETSTSQNDSDEKDVVTSAQEIEGFYLVKSVLRDTVASTRIVIRDTKSYCGILLDDNNRKPICRLYFNRDKKYIGLFDSNKNETRHVVDHLDDIFRFSEQLKATVAGYDSPQTEVSAPAAATSDLGVTEAV